MTRACTARTAARPSSGASRSTPPRASGDRQAGARRRRLGRGRRIFELVHEALNRRICDDNNARTAPTDCTAPCSPRAAPTPRGVADVQPVYDFLGDTYNFYNARWGRDSIDGAGMQLQGDGPVVHQHDDPEPDPAAADDSRTRAPTTTRSSAVHAGDREPDVRRPGRRLRRHHGPRADPRGDQLRVRARLPERVRRDQRVALRRLRRVGRPRQRRRHRHRGDPLADRRGQLARRDPRHGAPAEQQRPGQDDQSELAVRPGDNGGVHTNSGVNNKAMFLLTDGQTFNTYTVTPIGLEKAVRVYYEAQTNILTSGSDYGALANAPAPGVHEPHRHERDRRRRLHPGQQRGAGDRDGHRGGGARHDRSTAARGRPTIRRRPGRSASRTSSSAAQPAKPAATFQCSVDQGAELGGLLGRRAATRRRPPSRTATTRSASAASIGADTDPTPATRDFTVSTADMELVSKADSQDPAFAGETSPTRSGA